MKIDPTHNTDTSKAPTAAASAPTAAASELNNLLEIISGTSSVIENIWEGGEGSQKYFEMLRTSVDRAAKVTAQSGFECLDIFRKRPHHFDLILLDLSMPFMDGEETFVRLRGINPEAVVLLSTGFMAQERLDRMTASGMAGFLRKPHRPDEVVAHVRAVLESAKISRAGCAVDLAAS